jgi:ferredoxin--NADP+ reductase
MADLGTESNPFQVAIIGSGPSGFYAAEALLRGRPGVRVDMFDRLPTPFGLVRGGVAPDHPKIKQVNLVYDKIAKSPGFAFYGNVTIGRDLTLAELRATYHAVIVACGASADRRLDIPGESLPGSHTSTEFVGWYNGHPDYRDHAFDFSHEKAVVIGQGNVAADVARILATPVDDLRRTDIAEHAIESLSKSRIREIHIVGRRGPVQAKFTSVELKELGKINGCDAVAGPEDLELNAASAAEVANSRGEESRKNLEIFRAFSANGPAANGRRIHFRFLQTPVRINGASRVESITLARNILEGGAFAQAAAATSELSQLPCGLIFRSVGYRGLRMPGLAFDERSGTIPNSKGRCFEGEHPLPGLYVTGWIKRGPTGLIGTNRADSVETVAAIFEDLPKMDPAPKSAAGGLSAMLAARAVRVVSYADWQHIDASERVRGQPSGKPREKFTHVPDMIAAIDRSSRDAAEKSAHDHPQ